MIRMKRLAVAAFLVGVIATPLTAQVETAVPRLTAADYGPNISDRFREALLAAEAGDPMLGAKIMGGSEAVEGDDPWQAALVIGKTEEGVRIPFCGGTVIAPRWVLTAAHCVDNNTSASVVDVITGSIDLQAGQRTHVSIIAVHNGWIKARAGAPVYVDDIALLYLAAPVSVHPIAITSPTTGPVLERGGASTRVTGWGKTSEVGKLQNWLRTLTIPVVSNADCNNRVAYGDRDLRTPPLIDTMMCAGVAKAGFDACQGDSGGPLTGQYGGDRLLVGIVSWGDGCGRLNKYGVYTRVSAYSEWIHACMEGRPCPSYRS